MKNKFTLKSICIAAALSIFSVAGYAATITATVSGNWSSASTWSGGTAGATISTDNVVIPSGITVTMDIDVQVTGLLASLNVMGSLNSSATNSLTINNLANLSGSGSLNLQYLELGAAGGMAFTGSATIHKFVSSATSLSLASQVTLMDTLHLKSGSLSLGAGSNLMLGTNSNIKVEDGSLTIGGGLFTGTNSYNVLYVGGSKTAGIELSGAGFNNFNVQLSSGSQNLSLGSNITINGTLNHNMGNLLLNGKTLTIKGNYVSMNSSMISGSATSKLMIETATGLTSNLMFNSGSRSLSDLEINIASGDATLGTDLAINGELKLMKGNLNVINSSTITMNGGSQVSMDNGALQLPAGSFNGTASYNVNYMGASKTASVELTGAGLNNVTLQLNNATDSIKINGNTTVKGMLSLNKGSFHLNGKKLYLQGNLSSSANGWFQASGASELYINTTAGLTDTINFASSMNRLNSLTVNTGNSSNIMIGSALYVENVILTSGGITIFNNDLTVNATGSITGYSTTKYIRIDGTGSLVMNVNSPSAYVMYPVGTTTSMAAAYIQRNSGSGMIGVSTHNGIYQQGTSGVNNATTESVVNRTWDVKSMASASIDLNVKFEWTTAMEVNGFDRNNAYISHYSNFTWDTQASATASVVGSGTYQLSRTGITSLSPFAVVDRNSAVGIAENTEAQAHMYPNPTSDKLNISLPAGNNFKVEVYDGIGNLVLVKDVTDESSKHIDLSSLTNGIYMVKVSHANTQSVKRVVKQ
ncbi:MAG: T9SS type A sorting domain-containing protein [Bacteroidota bacterium]